MTATLEFVGPSTYPQPKPPVFIGPTWRRDELGEFDLPEITLGWQIIAWIEANLLADAGGPFRLTGEQQRFILWWYAIDRRGRFVYREGVLQRLKGWGKDPLAAVMSAVEFVGPCRFDRWATTSDDERWLASIGIAVGEPIAVPHRRAWIQLAAVSKQQTRNTMTLFPGLFTKACMREHGIDINKEIIYAYHGARRIEAVTSSPRALEGGRPSFVIRNETHHWIDSNEGHEMAAVIDRNATKSKDGAARVLSITNAYEPSENSVAQQQREAWDAEHSGESISTGVLYDSIEAHPDALMRLPARETGMVDDRGRAITIEPTEDEIKAYIGAVVAAVRGDAVWLDVERIVATILDRKNPVSGSRRFYYNQIVAREDAWLNPGVVDLSADPLAVAARAKLSDRSPDEILRAGWLVGPTEPIVMFLDGSKSQDATALVGCRLSDGYVFTIGVWAPPLDVERAKLWTVPRFEVDARVDEAFTRFEVVDFFGDPSHALDDEGGARFWDSHFDRWHRLYHEQLQVWAVRTGDHVHSILWDMTSPERQRSFVGAAEQFVAELEAKDEDDLEFRPEFLHDGHPLLVSHLKNAQRNPGPFGVGLRKDNRSSRKKIDLAVCAVGARMLRRLVLNRGLEQEETRGGQMWGY